ncbi:hypothetical protein HK102_004065 [Quaeritorhiza haematococci]|nr:hypothetical protein HK102_004065 [Quaeritorhiza haematococci]
MTSLPRVFLNRAGSLAVNNTARTLGLTHTTLSPLLAAQTIRTIQTSRPSQKATATATLDSLNDSAHPPYCGSFDFENQPQPRPTIPSYLSKTYTWCYLSPTNVPRLNNDVVVTTLLFGWADPLIKSAVKEFSPGMRVLQPAAVYGKFSRVLAEKLGPTGHLTVSDVAPIQLQTLRPKITHMDNITLRLADARHPVGSNYDGVCCFFLLHEVPDDVKAEIVQSLIDATRPGGKVVFIDYHNPAKFHPLRPLLSFVADTLEPFAKGLWRREIRDYCKNADKYDWKQELMFGNLYQKVIVTKPE